MMNEQPENAMAPPEEEGQQLTQEQATELLAAMADKPEFSRYGHLFQFVIDTSQNPVRKERSAREKQLGLYGRMIIRDVRAQTRFLASKYFPHQGKRETERRLRTGS